MTLKDLPALVVEEITLDGDELRVRGRFSHLTGVVVGISHLYCGDAQWPGELIELDDTRYAIFKTPLWVQRDLIKVGSVVPWLPSGWQFFHVNMILTSSWECRTFVPSDAQHFRCGNIDGSTKAGARLGDGYVLTHIEEGGWDHEECQICYGHIGRGGTSDGYVNRDDAWLCHACYERYGRARDLGFIFATYSSF
jgi:hypothetical protein